MVKDSKSKDEVIIPLGDRVLLKEMKDGGEEKNKSGIIIPDTVDQDKGAKRAKVVAVGPGKYEDGKLIPLSLKKGETVLYQWGDKVVIDDVEYVIVRESEVIAVVK